MCRKIRCIFLTDGNACHNCAANRITCLFAPRAKAGRPTGRSRINSTQRQWGDTDAFSESSDSLGSADDLLDMSLGGNDHWDMSEEAGQSKALQMPPQFYFQNSCLSWPDGSDLDDMSIHSMAMTHETLPGSGLHSYTGSLTSNSMSANSTTLSPPPATPLASSILETLPPLDHGLHEGQAFSWTDTYLTPTPVDFDTALRLCADLDARCRSIQEANCLKDTEKHLAALDTVCMATIKTQPELDSASRGLVHAALHKAMEICEMLIRAVAGKSGGTESTMLVQLLLLRRLNIFVSFTKICFARTSQTNGVKKAEEIHRSIDKLLHLDYGDWM